MNETGNMNSPYSGNFLEDMMHNDGLSDDVMHMSLEDLAAGRQGVQRQQHPQYPPMHQEAPAPRQAAARKTAAPKASAPKAQPAVSRTAAAIGRGKNTVIKVVGVGGAGCNALERMLVMNKDSIENIEFIAVNTDTQALELSKAPKKIAIGSSDKLNKGRGAGSVPELGAKAAEMSAKEIEDALMGADIVFIAAGMGRGTGTGAAPVIADIAKGKLHCLTIAVVTKPFEFEGKVIMDNAIEGIANLSARVDTIITVSNQRLFGIDNLTFLAAFGRVDDILASGVIGISKILSGTGVINVDYADLCSILENGGPSQVGIGEGKGDDRAMHAAQNCMFGQLLETTLSGAKAVLFNITANSNLSIKDVETAAKLITDEADKNAKIVMGVVRDDSIEDDSISITLIATGLQTQEERDRERSDDSSLSDDYGFSRSSYMESASLFSSPEPVSASVVSTPKRTQPAAVISSASSSSSDDDDGIPTFLRRRVKKANR